MNIVWYIPAPGVAQIMLLLKALVAVMQAVLPLPAVDLYQVVLALLVVETLLL